MEMKKITDFLQRRGGIICGETENFIKFKMPNGYIYYVYNDCKIKVKIGKKMFIVTREITALVNLDNYNKAI
jgi:hypothetical protein